MRKYIKKQLINMTNTLLSAEELLHKLLMSNDTQNLSILLQDMQSAAIEIGKTLEHAKEGFDIIHILEEICEILWKISQTKTTERKVLCSDYHKKVIQVQNELSFLPEKTIVVFLPYKASMWTSLESIWQAADKDKDCQTIVMPIPYFDIDRFGNKVNVNYEGDLFPDYVPITHYTELDLRQLHPEIIYIHNPYDGYNTLTRVPEIFYTQNLKEKTECLVYSPYAMESRTNDSDLRRLLLPGYQCADKLIVQNKKMESLFKKLGMPAEKLLTYGCPKLDAIANFKKDEVVWKWERNSELQNKTIFLLNIHLSYFTKNDEVLYKAHLKIINKIIDIIQNDDSLAMIVRPHPLIKTWIAKTHPERIAEYENIEKRITTSAQCVLDTSGSYLEAFALSSALVSTFSSLITEYMATAKPILVLQNSPSAENMKSDVVNYSGNYFTTDENSKLLLPIAKFIEMVKENNDPLLERRMEIIKSDLGTELGYIGEKIHRRVKEDL